MKLLLWVITLILLGCNQKTDDLQQFVTQVKNTASPIPIDVPEIKSFNHLAYSAGEFRSPFQPPEPAAGAVTNNSNQHCQQPSLKRVRFPLEKFSLENLVMRGTIKGKKGLWALIEADNNTLYRTTEGEYLGLFNGQIIAINQNHIEIRELLPDGTGCWQPRETYLRLREGNE